jgi:hypothetical protein
MPNLVHSYHLCEWNVNPKNSSRIFTAFFNKCNKFSKNKQLVLNLFIEILLSTSRFEAASIVEWQHLHANLCLEEVEITAAVCLSRAKLHQLALADLHKQTPSCVPLRVP